MSGWNAKAVIFDLDGILLDTEKLYTEATQNIVGRFGKTYTFDIKAQTMGRDARFGADLLIRTLELPLTVDEYLVLRRTELRELFKASEPMPGAVDFVRDLKAAGAPLAMATSSFRELAAIKLADQDWTALFDVVLYGDDPRIRALKPAPDIFLLAARELGVPIHQCVIFEDSPAGVEAGIQAGARVVAMPDPRLPKEKTAAAHRVIAGYHAVSPADFGFSQGGVE